MAEKKQSKAEQQRLAKHREKALKASKIVHHHARHKVGGFLGFVREQGVVGLAVGLAIGLQATEFTKVIVTSVITPVVDLLVGKGGLTGLQWTLNIGTRSGTFDVGGLIDALLKFIAVAFVIYFVVKGLKLDKLDKPKEG